MRLSLIFLLAAFGLAGESATATTPTPLLDNLTLGDTPSEQTHALAAEKSVTAPGALGQPARTLLPGGAESWEGGRLSFTMKIAPEGTNYLTVRFWGDEVNNDYLLLFCEGKQVGYRHLGDIDILALPDDEPRSNGRFYYVTTPLPEALTKGKSAIHLEIRSTGPIWGYGTNFDQYQKPMIVPSRGIYRLYTHTDGCFVPPADEKQGEAPTATPRTAPGPEILRQARERVTGALEGILKSNRPPDQMQMQFLAHAYFVKWTPAFQEKQAVAQVVVGVDELYQRWKKDPLALWQDKATWNPGWFGVGPAGDAVRLLAKPLLPALEQKLDGEKTRIAAWSEVFQAGRDYLRTHRRWLSNQALFSDVNIYLANRGLAAINPAQALPEDEARDYLYQATGLSPWLGSDTEHGPEKPFGNHFFEVTNKRLTRELGYVGNYGEVGVAGVMECYEATREPGGEGDPKIKAQLAKMLRARAPFRYPALDEENHPAMRLETGIGWRDDHFPGRVVYVQPPGGEQSPLRSTAATLDPDAIGYVQQMFSDHQFFSSVAGILKDKRFRNTVGLLGLPDEYDLLQAQPASPHRLPMAWDQPDFAFADEEDGVIALKHGQEILYVSLYWRAHYALNFLARTHYLTPRYQQVAVVREEIKAELSGQTYTRPDWINFGFGNGGKQIHYPADLHQAFAGEQLPIPKIPAEVKFKPGDDNHFAGRGDFYTLRYGPYLIAMNATADQTFDLPSPPGVAQAPDLISGKTLPLNSPIKVGPRSTVVLYLKP